MPKQPLDICRIIIIHGISVNQGDSNPFIFVGTSPFVGVFDLTSSGQNQFTILADGSERISSISFESTVPIQEVKQVRIGGATRASSVPDGGTSAALLGAALLGLGGIHRKLGGSCA